MTTRKLVPSRTLSWILVTLLAVALPAGAQLTGVFSQGLTMTETTTASGKTTTATSYFSGNATKRAATDGQDTIIRFDQGKMITINNKKKTYSEITFEQLQKILDTATAGMKQDPEAMAAMQKMMGGASGPLTVTKQGAGEAIAGYATEKYLVTGPMEMEIWAAPELKVPDTFYDAFKSRLPSSPVMDMRKMYDAFKQINGWPMRSIVKIKMFNMNISSTTEVTSVQKGAIPPSTFEVPAGYKLVQEKF